MKKSYFFFIAIFWLGCASTSSNTKTESESAEPNAQAVENPEVPETLESEDEVFAVEETEISFSSLGAELKGTILKPKIDANLRVPGVVIAHDFGPLGRDGRIQGALGIQLPMEVPVYRTLAESIAERGFAVLIYDKRTCVVGGPGQCDYPRSHLDDVESKLGDALLADLNAAVGALGSQIDVDQSAVSIVGHGQGAELALAATGAKERILVGWAPVAPMKLVELQLAWSLAELEKSVAGRNDAETDQMNRVIEQLKTQLEAWKVAESKVSTGDTSGDFMGVSGKAWASLETVHQNALLAISADDLAVIGGKDFDLPTDAEEKLRNVKNAPEIVIIEGLTHPLVDLDQDPTVLSEALVDIIIQKLNNPN